MLEVCFGSVVCGVSHFVCVGAFGVQYVLASGSKAFWSTRSVEMEDDRLRCWGCGMQRGRQSRGVKSYVCLGGRRTVWRVAMIGTYLGWSLFC